jgi:hypothetical protein
MATPQAACETRASGEGFRIRCAMGSSLAEPRLCFKRSGQARGALRLEPGTEARAGGIARRCHEAPDGLEPRSRTPQRGPAKQFRRGARDVSDSVQPPARGSESLARGMEARRAETGHPRLLRMPGLGVGQPEPATPDAPSKCNWLMPAYASAELDRSHYSRSAESPGRSRSVWRVAWRADAALSRPVLSISEFSIPTWNNRQREAFIGHPNHGGWPCLTRHSVSYFTTP